MKAFLRTSDTQFNISNWASTAAKEFGASSFADSMDEEFQIPRALQLRKMGQGP